MDRFRSVPQPVKSSKVLGKVLDLMPTSSHDDLIVRASRLKRGALVEAA